MKNKNLAAGILPALALFTLSIGLMPSMDAQALSGSGSHLALGTLETNGPGIFPPDTTNGNISFTGTWGADAATAWQGTFTGIGPTPYGDTTGTANYDFTPLNFGFLPTGTYFYFSDLDSGSGSEITTLKAYDISNTLITTPWLSTVIEEHGTGASGGVPLLSDMPGWDFTSGLYTFDGNTTVGNPNLGFSLLSLTNVGYLDVNRNSTFTGFDVKAPVAVPEPSTYALFGIGFLALILFAGRRQA